MNQSAVSHFQEIGCVPQGAAARDARRLFRMSRKDGGKVRCKLCRKRGFDHASIGPWAICDDCVSILEEEFTR